MKLSELINENEVYAFGANGWMECKCPQYRHWGYIRNLPLAQDYDTLAWGLFGYVVSAIPGDCAKVLTEMAESLQEVKK